MDIGTRGFTYGQENWETGSPVDCVLSLTLDQKLHFVVNLVFSWAIQ